MLSALLLCRGLHVACEGMPSSRAACVPRHACACSLVLHELWWSRRQPLFNLTIITQLSVDRAEALFNQCT